MGRVACPASALNSLQGLWSLGKLESKVARQSPKTGQMAEAESASIPSEIVPPSSPGGYTSSDSGDQATSNIEQRRDERLARMLEEAVIRDDEDDEQGVFGRASSPALTDAFDTETDSDGPRTPPNEPILGLPKSALPQSSITKGHAKGPAATPQSAKERLHLLQQEFGPCEYLSEPEEFLSCTSAALIKGVCIRGTLFVTTQRVCYFALLPGIEDELAAPAAKRLSATVNFSCTGRTRQKLYIVLDSEGITGYASSKNALRPVGSCHFSNILDVRAFPTDFHAQPNLVTFTYIRRFNAAQHETEGQMEFDDAETAAQWRNELAAGFFKYHNERDRYKASVPFERIVQLDYIDWQDMTFMMTFHINAGASLDAEASERLDVGVLKSYGSVVNQVKEQLLKVREELKKQPGSKFLSPVPLLEILTPQGGQPVSKITSRAATLDQVEEPASPDTSMDEPRSMYENADLDDRYAPAKKEVDRFHYTFGLAPDEAITMIMPAYYVRSIPAIGQLAVSPRGVLFLRKTKLLQNVKIRIPVEKLKGAVESSSVFVGVSSLRIQIKGQPDEAFNFKNKKRRDWALKCINALAEQEALAPHGTSVGRRRASSVHPPRPAELSAFEAWQQESAQGVVRPNIRPELVNILPRILGDGETKFRVQPMKICCLTIGSRGDVQPYIALCQGLKKDGHQVTIATHPEFKEWVESFGIAHLGIGGDPSVLMEISVDHKIFSQETIKNFREWFDRLLSESYEAVKGHDVLIESPSAFAGVHIAEALKIPYFRAFTMPFSRTGTYPHPFINAPVPLTRAYNLSTYLLFDQILWRASSGQINAWRKKTLHLPETDLEQLHVRQIPFIYNFSEAVVPRPMDWPNSTVISGYWFIEPQEEEYKPPDSLVAFIKKARADKKPLVYCGFGSIPVSDPAELTKAVIESVKIADVRMVLAKGWSERRAGRSGRSETTSIPEEIYSISAVPHEWLFDQVDAAMHHGGAGTTAASLRHGLPTLIKPFFGDQYFWANRVSKLGAGMRVKSLSASDMAEAWQKATQEGSRIMREKAQLVGEQIRAENGVETAINFIYAFLGYASEQRGGSGVSAQEAVAVDGIPEAPKSPKGKKTAGRSPTRHASMSVRNKLEVLVEKTDGLQV